MSESTEILHAQAVRLKFLALVESEHFYVSDMRELAELAGITIDPKEVDVFRAFHCQKYKDLEEQALLALMERMHEIFLPALKEPAIVLPERLTVRESAELAEQVAKLRSCLKLARAALKYYGTETKHRPGLISKSEIANDAGQEARLILGQIRLQFPNDPFLTH